MTQIWWVDEVASFRTVKSWRQQGPAVLDEQLAAEAQRAVWDFRTQQFPVLAPASEGLSREMLLKAWNHVYEPQPLFLHPDEYATMVEELERQGLPVDEHQFTRELAMPVFDLEADEYTGYMGRARHPRWIPWYEPPIRLHHVEPPPRSASYFVITRLDE